MKFHSRNRGKPMKYEIYHVVTLKDGTMMSVEEYEKQREPIDWKNQLSVRATNMIRWEFGEKADLNNPKDRDRIARHNWLKVQNIGRKTYREIMGFIEEYWPWQERHGQGSKFKKRFQNISKENVARNRKIYQERLNGETYIEIGKRHGITSSRAREIFVQAQANGQEFLNPHGDYD